MKIRLPKGLWEFDPTQMLGSPGGFGTVYAGISEFGPIAVKRLKVDAEEAAHRELRIAQDLQHRSLSHIMPVLDSGQDADSGSYFVVMPRADGTLQDAISTRGSFPEPEAIAILDEIAAGLTAIGDLVHRDLKPANVLQHDGCWKIADFGIARFVEESTSVRTLRDCLTPHYAAPEQWQFARATQATDVYALGCIGYALLTGCPPFCGSDLRAEHLYSSPPLLSGNSPRIRSLLAMMLRKHPDSRPTVERVRSVLAQQMKPADEAPVKAPLQALSEISATLTEAESEAERMRAAEAAERKLRSDVHLEGRKILQSLLDELAERILAVAPMAQRHDSAKMRVGPGIRLSTGVHLSLVLGNGLLRIGRQTEVLPRRAFERSGWDVLTVATIQLKQADPQYVWSASLWYAQRPEAPGYRWYEVSFFGPLSQEDIAPYALDPPEADVAAGPGIHKHRTAWGPVAIDDEDQEDFIERWTALLALACKGALRYPRCLPLRDKFWDHPAF